MIDNDDIFEDESYDEQSQDSSESYNSEDRYSYYNNGGDQFVDYSNYDIKKDRKGAATAAVICGILSVIGAVWCCGLLFAIAAIICGVVYLSSHETARKKMAVFGIITGIIGAVITISLSVYLSSSELLQDNINNIFKSIQNGDMPDIEDEELILEDMLIDDTL